MLACNGQITDAQTNLVFRLSNDEGNFDVVGYGKKATKNQSGPDARPGVWLLRAEVRRRKCTKNNKPCKPRGWNCGDCVATLAACSRGFPWTDPDQVDQAVTPSARMSANKEGARAMNYIADHAAAFRASEGVDARQALDEKMAKTTADRERDSFWYTCAEAVQATVSDPEIDEMQVSGNHYGHVDPSLPDGGCCPALTTEVCALKLKALVKAISSQVGNHASTFDDVLNVVRHLHEKPPHDDERCGLTQAQRSRKPPPTSRHQFAQLHISFNDVSNVVRCLHAIPMLCGYHAKLHHTSTMRSPHCAVAMPCYTVPAPCDPHAMRLQGCMRCFRSPKRCATCSRAGRATLPQKWRARWTATVTFLTSVGMRRGGKAVGLQPVRLSGVGHRLVRELNLMQHVD